MQTRASTHETAPTNNMQQMLVQGLRLRPIEAGADEGVEAGADGDGADANAEEDNGGEDWDMGDWVAGTRVEQAEPTEGATGEVPGGAARR